MKEINRDWPKTLCKTFFPSRTATSFPGSMWKEERPWKQGWTLTPLGHLHFNLINQETT